jgi:hypothetical protein
MREMRRAVTHHDFGRHADLAQRIRFEGSDVGFWTDGSEWNWVDQGRGDVFDRGEALVEGAAAMLFDHRVRDRRAGFVVAGELAQDLRLLQPVP